MTGTNRVEIETLKEKNVLYHAFHRNSFSKLRMYVMPIGSFKKDQCIVDIHLIIPDLYLTEAILLARRFKHIACGIKQFQTKGGARYLVLFYKANRFSGTLTSSDEGEVFWLPREELDHSPLASDFAEMLKVFEDDTLSEFYYLPGDEEWHFELL